MDKNGHSNGPFHAGELSVQAKAGVLDFAESVGASIHDDIPYSIRVFLAEQSLVFFGSTDDLGRVWASVLTGAPGQVAHAISLKFVEIGAEPDTSDPLSSVWISGTSVGLLVIDLRTRRRVRVNGTLVRSSTGTMLVEVSQAYANCPKYIQKRDLFPGEIEPENDKAVSTTPALTETEIDWVRSADTCFIATVHMDSGADVSHRGGKSGFIRVTDDGLVVTIPDYSGNNMFNTLGNIELNPRAGLLFVDFVKGDTLQITGRAKVVWEERRRLAFPGAERIVEFAVEQAAHRPNAVPLRWRFVAPSPFNPS